MAGPLFTGTTPADTGLDPKTESAQMVQLLFHLTGRSRAIDAKSVRSDPAGLGSSVTDTQGSVRLYG